MPGPACGDRPGAAKPRSQLARSARVVLDAVLAEDPGVERLEIDRFEDDQRGARMVHLVEGAQLLRVPDVPPAGADMDLAPPRAVDRAQEAARQRELPSLEDVLAVAVHPELHRRDRQVE